MGIPHGWLDRSTPAFRLVPCSPGWPSAASSFPIRTVRPLGQPCKKLSTEPKAADRRPSLVSAPRSTVRAATVALPPRRGQIASHPRCRSMDLIQTTPTRVLNMMFEIHQAKHSVLTMGRIEAPQPTPESGISLAVTPDPRRFQSEVRLTRNPQIRGELLHPGITAVAAVDAACDATRCASHGRRPARPCAPCGSPGLARRVRLPG